MNPVIRLREQLNDPRNRSGRAGNAVVDARCLREVIERYEAMDSLDRAMHITPAKAASHLLHESVLALYHTSLDPVLIMNVVMEALNPMVKQSVEDNQAKAYFHEGGK
jgi:hypothetical protein